MPDHRTHAPRVSTPRHRPEHPAGASVWLFLLLASALAWGSSGCGAATASTPESSTLHVGHRVGGGRVTGASPTEISVSTQMYADLELFEPVGLDGGGFIRDADEITPTIIQSAVSSDETIVRIDTFRGSYAKIEGMRPGTAQVSFVTSEGHRAFAVHVAEPAEVRVNHYVWDLLGEDVDVAFSQGGTARFEMSRRDMAHRLLGGYGAALPLHVDPPRAARLSIRDGDVEHVDVHLEEAHETVTLRPLGGPPVSFSVVVPSADDVWGVSAIDPEGGEIDLHPLAIGQSTLVTIWSRTASGTRLLGLTGLAALVSVSPEVCEAESDEDVHGDGVFRLRGVGAGNCLLEVQGGETTLNVSVPVEDDAALVADDDVSAAVDAEADDEASGDDDTAASAGEPAEGAPRQRR